MLRHLNHVLSIRESGDKPESAHSKRYLALDGLRGIAAVLVVMFHMRWTNHFTDNAFVKHGYLAVDLFFILSGFVIAASYSNAIVSAVAFGRFVCLRFFRVYPLHLVLLLVFASLELAKLWALRSGTLIPGQEPFTDDRSFGAFVANVFLLHSLGTVNQLSWNTPSWSISCEFAAYLIFAGLTLFGAFRQQFTLVLGGVLATAGYLVLVITRHTLDITYDWGIVRCLAGFFFGVLVFEWSMMKIGKWLSSCPTTLIGACELALLVALIAIMSIASGAAIVLVIPIFVAVVAVLQLDRGPLAYALKSAPAQFLGRISYSIYMVHFVVIVLLTIVLKRLFGLTVDIDIDTHVPFMRLDPWVGNALVFGTLIIVFTIAVFTHKLIEEPGRRLGRQIAYSSKARSANDATGSKVPN